MDEKFILKPVEETEEQKTPIKLVIPDPTLTELVTVRVSAETKKSLEALAKKYKMTMSEVVRQLAEQGMELVKRQK